METEHAHQHTGKYRSDEDWPTSAPNESRDGSTERTNSHAHAAILWLLDSALELTVLSLDGAIISVLAVFLRRCPIFVENWILAHLRRNIGKSLGIIRGLTEGGSGEPQRLVSCPFYFAQSGRASFLRGQGWLRAAE